MSDEPEKKFIELGLSMRRLRKEFDLTQNQISSKAKFSSVQAISNMERGIQVPSPKLIKAFVSLVPRKYREGTLIAIVGFVSESHRLILIDKIKKVKL